MKTLTTPILTKADREIESTLRPKRLSEFIGQSKITENLGIFIEAAKKRKEPLDHLLFYGPPGLGKTTLSYIIAEELGVSIKCVTAPLLERGGDLAVILTGLSCGDVLFIDEIHRLNKSVEELLYLAMEDFKLNILVGKGPSARTIVLDLPKFTLIGATTRAGILSSPLRDRFGIVNRLDFYTEEEIREIITRSAKLLSIKIEKEAVSHIAKRSRGTPRVANRLLRRIRDFAEVINNGIVSEEVAIQGLEKLEVDELGLDSMDRKLLSVLIEKFKGGPVGIKTLTVACIEEQETIEDIHEPYLIQMGLLDRTIRGRIATPLAYEHLKRIQNKCLII